MSTLLTQLGQKTKVELDKKLALAGGTMTGAITLSGAPTASAIGDVGEPVDPERLARGGCGGRTGLSANRGSGAAGSECLDPERLGG